MPCVALSYRKLYRAPLTSSFSAQKSAAKSVKKAERAVAKTAEKTARRTQNLTLTPEIAAAFVAPVSIFTSALLKDGDYVQIRPYRPRSTAKLSRFAVWKSARALKKLVKAQNKSRRAAIIKAQNEFRRTAMATIQIKPQIKPQSAKIINHQPKSQPISQTSAVAIAPQPQPQSQTQPVIPAQLAKIPAPKPEPLAQSVVQQKPRRNRPVRADLINAESRIGSTIFGPIPAGRRREFFHDRNNIWIWHESWLDAAAEPRELTVRYEVRPSGVYKKLAAGKYFKLEGAELENFRRAARTYLRLIKQHLYHLA